MEDKNYKKLYEDALERARQVHLTNVDENKKSAEYIFPELKESEEERILNLIKAALIYCDSIHVLKKEEFKECNSWLEKQGEQKPIMIQWKGDNLREVVEFTGKSPKFNEWFKTWDDYENYVHSHGNIFKLFWEDGSHYEVPVGAWIVKTPDGYNVASKAVLKQKPADEVEPKFKVGDRVNQNDREDEEYNILTITSVNIDEHYYICHQDSVIDFEEQDLWHIVEQNPAWSEEGEANIDYSSEIIGFLKNYIKVYGCTAINSWVNWLKNIRDRVQLQPKQEWNEANDSMIEGIKIATLNYYDKENADEIISWLESIKERVQPQQQQEWSEEDEKKRKGLIKGLEDKMGFGWASDPFSREEYIDWLKSIKPQKHWKPSDEQIEALNAINNIGELSYVEQSDLLVKLYNDLKKL